MLTVCKKCQKEQEVDTSKVKGKVVRYNCEFCETPNLFVLPPQKDKKVKNVQIKTKGFSIKTKITLIIVALVVFSISAVGFIATYKGGQALSSQAENHLVQITSQKAVEYNMIFSRLQDEIEGAGISASQTFSRKSITEDLDIDVLMPWNGEGYGSAEVNMKLRPEVLEVQRVSLVLKGLVEKNQYIELGYMASQNNVMAFSDEAIAEVLGSRDAYVPTERPWYKGASEEGKTIWTQPYVDASTNKLIVSCATPVFDDSEQLVGVVGFDVLLDTIQKDIVSLDIGYNSHAFLVGKDGSVLAEPEMNVDTTNWRQSVTTDNLLETNNVDLKEIVKKMIAGDQGLGHVVENNDKTLLSYASLPAIGASVGITVSEKEVMKPALDIQKLILGAWGVVVLLSIIIGYAIGNSVTKPINEIIKRADLISKGETDLDVMETKRTDEIGILVDSFNRLISSLKIAMSIGK